MHCTLLVVVVLAESVAGFSTPIRPVTRHRGFGRSAMPMRPVTRHRALALPAMDLFSDFKKGIAKLQAGVYDEAAIRTELQMQIRRKPCVMYSFSTCPFCKQAKDILSSMGAVYTVIELDEVDNGMALRAELASITGRTSVPAVFAGGKFLGGCNDGGEGGIANLKANGRLDELLAQAGAWSPGRRI